VGNDDFDLFDLASATTDGGSGPEPQPGPQPVEIH